MSQNGIEVVENRLVNGLFHLKSLVRKNFEYKLDVCSIPNLHSTDGVETYVLVELQPPTQWFAAEHKKYGEFPQFLVAVHWILKGSNQVPVVECQLFKPTLTNRYCLHSKSVFTNLVKELGGFIYFTE